MAEIASKAKDFALYLWDVVIPRFITEEVALIRSAPGPRDDIDNYEIVCSIDDADPGEIFDAIATVHAFQAFGRGFAYRIENFRPWPEDWR